MYSISQIKNIIFGVFEEKGYFLPLDVLNNDADIDLSEYDISSIDIISIIIGLEDEFCLNIPDESISVDLFKSFNGLSEYIKALLDSDKPSLN